jgi:hypothetical protein
MSTASDVCSNLIVCLIQQHFHSVCWLLVLLGEYAACAFTADILVAELSHSSEVGVLCTALPHVASQGCIRRA